MSSVSLHDIGLKPSLLRAAEKRVRAQGMSEQEYLQSLIERDLLANKSFDQILKPVRAGFKSSGVTEDELEALVSQARKAIYAKKHRKVRR